jgi:predicted RecA/RadA family phage recombinase
MAEYAPVFFPADRFSSTSSAAVTAGQLLYVSGDNTVAPTTAATGAWIGVAARDVASGAGVTVYTEGIHEVPASGTINAGDVVIPAAAGAVAAIGAGTTYSQVVGVAISAAASSKVRIKLRS